MKTLIIALISLISSLNASATVVQSRISSVDWSPKENEPHLVLLEKEGWVGFLDHHSATLRDRIQWLFQNHHRVEFTLDSAHRIQSVRSLGPSPQSKQVRTAPQNFVYTPTVVGSDDEATEIFNELNPNANSKSECYNRAHVWTYEEKLKRDLNSMKVFLFFTYRYIREYNYGWWFHVAPFLMVKQGTTTMEQVTDPEFTSSPQAMKDWTDIFIAPKVDCPVIQKYSDYEQHQEAQYCYRVKVSMHYWQPRDIQQNEIDGSLKTEFIPSEVEWAYSQGF